MSETERLRSQLWRFLLVGGFSVLIDAAVYYALVHFKLTDAVMAKRISFAAGALWAFFANKFFTFNKVAFSKREPVFFIMVYLIGWLLNSLVHDFILHASNLRWLAFLAATGISTVTNFIGQKWLVFRG